MSATRFGGGALAPGVAIPIRLGAAVSAAPGLACTDGAEPPLTTNGAASDFADLPVAPEAESFVEAEGCVDVLSIASGMFCASSAADGAVVGALDEAEDDAGVVETAFGPALTGFGAGSAGAVAGSAGTDEVELVAGMLAGWLDRPWK